MYGSTNNYLLGLLLGTEQVDLLVGLLAVPLAQRVLLQLPLQIQLLPPDLGTAREDRLQRVRHPGGEREITYKRKAVVRSQIKKSHSNGNVC